MKDLNLYKVFEAVITTNSVNGAADKLNITSSAISQSLNKLRAEYNDPLFIRSGQGLKPTSFALQTYDQIKDALAILNNNSSIESNFDPKTSERTFKIAIQYDIDLLLYARLMKLKEEKAPNIKIEIVNKNQDEDVLQNTLRLRNADLIITTIELEEMSYSNKLVHEEDIFVFARKNHPLLKDGVLTKDIFFEAEHAGVMISDDMKLNSLAKISMNDRKIVYYTNSLLNMLFMSTQSDLFTIGYRSAYNLIKGLNNLDCYPIPFECDRLPIYMTWHKTFEKEEGLKWLRDEISGIFQNISEENN